MINPIVHFVLRHGYPILFAAVFARQIGLPIPAPGFLLAAGALAACGKLRLLPALALAVAACVVADWIWYEAGRAWGDKVLEFIHMFTPNRELVGSRARKLFAHHGPPLLVLDKFVPGLDAVVPPLAGASGTQRFRFVGLDAIGAILWSTSYAGIGFVFSHDLDRAATYVLRAGRVFAAALFAVVAIYVLRKLARRRRWCGRFPGLVPQESSQYDASFPN